MNITQMHHYQDDQRIIKEGDAGDELFIILDGEVRLHKDDAYITTLKRGDHFGEMTLVDRDVRSASASAVGSARLLVISRREFYQIIRDEPNLAVKLLWSFVSVLTQRLRKTTAALSGARTEALLPDMSSEVMLFDEEASGA
jgi:CRP-like cAMP-binding protein